MSPSGDNARPRFCSPGFQFLHFSRGTRRVRGPLFLVFTFSGRKDLRPPQDGILDSHPSGTDVLAAWSSGWILNCGLRNSSNSSTEEHVRNAHSQVPPRPAESDILDARSLDLSLNKPPRDTNPSKVNAMGALKTADARSLI